MSAAPTRAGRLRFLRDKVGQLVGLIVFPRGLGGELLRLFDVPQFILPTPIEIIERIVKDAVTGLIFIHVASNGP